MNDKVYRAIADPTRRRILKLLGAGEMPAGAISANFDISAPSMSHHFTVLREAGLVFTRRDGQQIIYSLNTTVFEDLVAALMEVFSAAGPGKEETS